MRAKLDSDRLILRKPILGDAGTVFERYAQDSIVVRYLTWPNHEYLGQTEEFLERAARDWETGAAFEYVIALREPLEDFAAPWFDSDQERENGRGRVEAGTAIGMIGASPMNPSFGLPDEEAGVEPEFWEIVNSAKAISGNAEAENGDLEAGDVEKERWANIEIGYVLARPFWGRGYMTEALGAVIDECFTLPSCVRVIARCDVENLGSSRVTEKAGMKRLALLRDSVEMPDRGPGNGPSGKRDEYIYGISRG